MSPLLIFIVSAIVVVYGVNLIFIAPDLGFTVDPITYQVSYTRFEVTGDKRYPRLGDLVLEYDHIPSSVFMSAGGPSIFSVITARRSLLLKVKRAGRVITIRPPVSEPDPSVSLMRAVQLLPAAAFLLAALIVHTFLRPNDEVRSTLLVAFSFSAIWSCAMKLSFYNLLLCDQIFRAAIWLSLPAYLHFSWIYPRPLLRLPEWVGPALYGGAGLLALTEILIVTPPSFFLFGLLVMMFGSLALVSGHLVFQKGYQRDLRLMFMILGVAFLLAGVASLLTLVTSPSQVGTELWSTVLLPAIPLAILYPMLRRKFPGFELRTNQSVILIVFVILLLLIALIVSNTLELLSISEPERPAIELLLVVALALASSLAYPHFRLWAQRHILRLPIPPNEMVQRYAGHIATSLEPDRLAGVICGEVLPSLLIQQGALLHLDQHLTPSLIAQHNISDHLLPKKEEIQTLLEEAGNMRNTRPGNERIVCPWVRLALKLEVEGRPVGLMLLGRRDPDDFYSSMEIPVLQSLMDQTALALFNVEQAQRLHAFHQANIQRHEAERIRLSRELHDSVLGQFALLMFNGGDYQPSDQFQMAYQSAVDKLRSIINGLQPHTLSYGIRMALRELVDELSAQATYDVEIQLNLSEEEVDYSAEMALHLYRIVQEACHNAILHGRAQQIEIRGVLREDSLQLEIVDNGIGFEVKRPLNLTDLLSKHHLGLANIFERAAIINAQVQIFSTPQQGTRVQVNWPKKL